MRESLAVVLALAAAGLYGLGNALEHRVVSEQSASSSEGGLLRRLVRRPLWVLGMTGDVGAYGFQAAALAVGGLLLVQPLLVCGLLVALPLNARWTGRRVRRREWIAATILCASLATFLIEASPSGGVATAATASWLRVGGSIGALIALALVLAAAARGHVRAALLGFAAGGLFGITAALTKTFVEQIQRGVPYTATHWEVYALAILSIVGILFTQHGFQSASLSASLPALEATEPITAAFVGIAVLHEHLDGRTPAGDALIAGAALLALLCVVFLAIIAGQDASVAAAAEGTVPALPARSAAHSRRRSAHVPRRAAASVGVARRSLPARPRRRRAGHESFRARSDDRPGDA